MLKVGFITSEVVGSAGRGIGVYTGNLLSHLQKIDGISVTQIPPDPRVFPEYDVVHYPYFDLFYHTLPLFLRAKFVVTCHDVTPLEFPDAYPPGIKGSLNLILQKTALQKASAVITDSYASVGPIHKYLNVDHSKIYYIYLGPNGKINRVSNPKDLKTIKAKYHLPDKYVLYVGDINFNKNLPFLFKACAGLKVPLVLVGKQAAALEEIDDRHPEHRHFADLKSYLLPPNTNILRLGFVPDSEIGAVFSQASVYCQPSLAEGFGLPVLEAMACGTPVACSNTHSLPEIAGDSAVYFDPASEDSIMEALTKLLSDSSLRASLSKSGLLRAKKFSWEKAARETLAVYKSL